MSAEDRERWVAFVETLAPDIDPRAVRLMDRLRQVAHSLAQIGENSLAAASLSYARYRLLWTLLYQEEAEGRAMLTPSEISRRQGTSRNTISSLIRELEEEGLVERHLDLEDRRRFNIELTDAGRERVREHASRHLHIMAGCFDGLLVEEQEQLIQLLHRLSAGIGLDYGDVRVPSTRDDHASSK